MRGMGHSDAIESVTFRHEEGNEGVKNGVKWGIGGFYGAKLLKKQGGGRRDETHLYGPYILVILSGVDASRTRSATESKDPYTLQGRLREFSKQFRKNAYPHSYRHEVQGPSTTLALALRPPTPLRMTLRGG